MVDPDHYRGLPGQRTRPAVTAKQPLAVAPEVEIRPLTVYEEVSYAAAI